MARRRLRRRMLKRRLPVIGGVLGVVVLVYALWPSSGGENRAPRLTGEVDTGPALRPVVSPVSSGDTPARPSEARPAPAPAGPAAAEPQAPAPPATQPAVVAAMGPRVSDFEAGMAAKGRRELLAARERLNRALTGGALSAQQMEAARQALTELADQTIFSTHVASGDSLVDHHQVAAGETLGKLAKQYSVSEDLLAEVNRLRDKHFIRLGTRLKVIRGPFHATVTKSDHLMHVFLGDVYVRSWRVALGAEGKTPTGKWRVTSRQANPGWVDPQTGKRYHPDDPANPIGEYWIGLEGIEGAALGAFGYGIHGTNEPETIGQDVSLGCIRLAPDDVAFAYRLLLPGASYVTTSD